jgi:hypothetical protein
VTAGDEVCLGVAHPAIKNGGCQRGVLEGSVHAGEEFVRPIGRGLEVMLEPLGWGSGWLLRVLPVHGPRPAHDYAELATPPYSSVSPLLISTDFSFRSQDAVAWNPRHFRFAASEREFGRMLELYDEYRRSSPPAAGVESELAETVSRAPEGVIQILDANLIPGLANQSQMAAAVASHFITTAHTVEEPSTGKGTGLGRLTWIRFRISLDIPKGFGADRGMTLTSRSCP